MNNLGKKRMIICLIVCLIEIHRGPKINPNIYVKLWKLILVVIISIVKQSPDEIITKFALFRFQGVTILCSLWKAPQIIHLSHITRIWRIVGGYVVLGGYVVIYPSIDKTCIWLVKNTGAFIQVIAACPTINANESWKFYAKK
jgi:hypothetical protein